MTPVLSYKTGPQTAAREDILSIMKKYCSVSTKSTYINECNQRPAWNQRPTWNQRPKCNQRPAWRLASLNRNSCSRHPGTVARAKKATSASRCAAAGCARYDRVGRFGRPALVFLLRPLKK